MNLAKMLWWPLTTLTLIDQQQQLLLHNELKLWTVCAATAKLIETEISRIRTMVSVYSMSLSSETSLIFLASLSKSRKKFLSSSASM